MRPRERFLAALRRQPVDQVPLFDFLFQRPIYTHLIGRTPDAYNARDAVDLSYALGLDGVWVPFGCFSGWSPERLSANVYRDEWGTTFERSASSWPIDAPIDYPLKSRADLKHYVAPDPDAPGRLAEIETALAMNLARGDEAIAVVGGVGGPLTTTWMLMGYETLSVNLYDDLDFLKETAEIATDFAVRAVRRMAKAGVDGMFVSEDLGSSCSGLISPEHFRAVYKPALETIFASIKEANLPVLLHSCGRVTAFLDDLVDMGIDAIHPLQRTAGMDLAEVKRKYGSRVCLIGNIDSSSTLPFGSLDQIEREVREAIWTAAPRYGYILASDHSLHDGIPVESILCMFEAARKFGVYPEPRTRGVRKGGKAGASAAGQAHADAEGFVRSEVDRRAGRDRRTVHDLEYFEDGGDERRHYLRERRTPPERRSDWVRVSQWSSVYVGSGKAKPKAKDAPAPRRRASPAKDGNGR